MGLLRGGRDSGPADVSRSEQVVIALSGVDGSGKSTFATALQDHIGASRCVVLGTRFDPRTILGRWDPKRPASNVHRDYRDSGVKRGMRTVGLNRTYATLATRLYERQLAVQLAAVSRYPIVVADRFVIDFVADLIQSSLIRFADAPQFRDRLYAAATSTLVDAGDDVLRERAAAKGDDPALVVERAALYRELAPRLGLAVVDTQQFGFDAALDQVLAQVRLP